MDVQPDASLHLVAGVCVRRPGDGKAVDAETVNRRLWEGVPGCEKNQYGLLNNNIPMPCVVLCTCFVIMKLGEGRRGSGLEYLSKKLTAG